MRSPTLIIDGPHTQVEAEQGSCTAVFTASLVNKDNLKAENAKVYCRLTDAKGKVVVEEKKALGVLGPRDSRQFTLNLTTDCQQRGQLEVYCRSTCENCFKIPVEIAL
ncbi:MAG: hypothetical protein GF334_12615 [Candidatus Altiarchaeales archaeon]|nr:hypothetical protein [Candidatus Altiarchaeales archaeon]